MDLVTKEDIQQFARVHTGLEVNDFDALSLKRAIQSYVISRVRAANEPVQPPYLFGPRSDSLSVNQRRVLCDFANGRSRYKIFDVADEWVGRVAAPGLYVEHTSVVFIRKEMWKLKISGPGDDYLTKIFEETRDLRAKECYSIDQYRRNIPRTAKAHYQEGKRYRIPKSQMIRELRPFQQVHMPDDAGCYNVLPAELHLTKGFFAQHDEDISLWWSDSEDLWVLWTDWIRWIFDHRRRPEYIYNPEGGDYDAPRPSY